jgi:regulator of protease activity HflC (stomatin/prohibitin superfamily)
MYLPRRSVDRIHFQKNISIKVANNVDDVKLQILSRDSVTVAVDAVVYYRVQNPTIAVSNVENYR